MAMRDGKASPEVEELAFAVIGAAIEEILRNDF